MQLLLFIIYLLNLVFDTNYYLLSIVIIGLYCIFRVMLAELAAHRRNPAETRCESGADRHVRRVPTVHHRLLLAGHLRVQPVRAVVRRPAHHLRQRHRSRLRAQDIRLRRIRLPGTRVHVAQRILADKVGRQRVRQSRQEHHLH